MEELFVIYLNWYVASPQSVGGKDWVYMSAVCWHYGRMIHQALGGRPIGLVATTWGGTPIEVWMPPKALQAFNSTLFIFVLSFYLFIFVYRSEDVSVE